ncbi:MAG: hypothetical protein AAB923_03135, partial [Patescibacteria group bacterium]
MFKSLARILSSPLRIKLLKFFLCQPESQLSARTAASGVGSSVVRTDQELRALVSAGVLSSRGKRGRATYSVNQSHPLLVPLQSFIEASTLPSDRDLIAAFRAARGLSLLIAAGALVREARG